MTTADDTAATPRTADEAARTDETVRTDGAAPGEDVITPDSKDWTWVLERACPDCGLDTPSVVREEVAGLVRANAASWLAVLDAEEDALRRRPRPGVWSALEYACHVRDVFRLFHVRLNLMLDQDGPLFPNWDQDETALAERYGEQDPKTVAVDLAEAAEILAGAFDRVSGGQWQRTGDRTDGARFTVESFSRYLIHDPVHHLHDVIGDSAAQRPV